MARPAASPIPPSGLDAKKTGIIVYVAMDSPRVFLSYSHDSPEHEAAVLALSKQLRLDGCTAIIDQEQHWVSEGWTLWMMNQIAQADFVLVVCTEVYKRRAEGKEEPPIGAGASWEAQSFG